MGRKLSNESSLALPTAQQQHDGGSEHGATTRQKQKPATAAASGEATTGTVDATARAPDDGHADIPEIDVDRASVLCTDRNFEVRVCQGGWPARARPRSRSRPRGESQVDKHSVHGVQERTLSDPPSGCSTHEPHVAHNLDLYDVEGTCASSASRLPKGQRRRRSRRARASQMSRKTAHRTRSTAADSKFVGGLKTSFEKQHEKALRGQHASAWLSVVPVDQHHPRRRALQDRGPPPPCTPAC